MSNLLFELIGKKLKSIETIHDYIQLRFEDGALVNVFNKFEIENIDSTESDFVGTFLVAIYCEASEIRFVFDHRKTIRVGLRDEGCSGPEAIEYIASDGKIVVMQYSPE